MALRQLEKTYDPKQVEERWYQFWMEKKYFHATLDHPGEPYTIVIPPPNITGSLHIGHALNNTLQDILIRWRRMQGRNALWVPGTDHAGIATQNVVERQLMAEGSSREALGREAFITRAWDWKAQSGGTILQQLKRLGASCDWDRLRFTMDDGLSKAVREVFVRLYEEGLIYRGERLINWCPRCLTALSDIEVEHEETKGKLYHIRYPLADDPATSLVVATTRPETMLGDTAVAVHPEDPRYRHLIGKRVHLPLTTREIPIVGDSILVDREFGTGAVKITPAHDFNDFLAGERHHLPRLAILDAHARLDPEGLQKALVEPAVRESVQGLSVSNARPKIEEQLRTREFLVKVEDHKMALGKCYRCKTIVEPYLSPQWFVKIQPLADPAIKAVEDGRIRIIPEGWMNNYLGWMREIKDWCISRQIWWGHRIPAWYCRQCNEESTIQTASSGGGKRSYSFSAKAKPIVALRAPTHCPDCGQHDFIQESDVLDTWFSSALWPFSTLGWPDDTPELRRFYPTSTLVTGLDILFFWVARMIMMGLKFMGDVPFRDVYIHALVRDAEGQKMSKSKGNVIDPLSIMDTYGTDALRFTLASMASPGRDIKLAEERIEGYRNFANKIWNAARFVLMHADGERANVLLHQRSQVDQWIISMLHRCISQVNRSLEDYRFDEAATALYQFVWHEYCDWYLEFAKRSFSDQEFQQQPEGVTRQTLFETFEVVIRLLHPFMPFISEEIWQAFSHGPDSVMIASYPVADTSLISEDAESQISALKRVILEVREIRSSQGLAPSVRLPITVQPDLHVQAALNAHHKNLVSSIARISTLNIVDVINPTLEVKVSDGIPVDVQSSNRIAINVGDSANVTDEKPIVTINAEKEVLRIQKRLTEVIGQIEQAEKKLSNADFISKAPTDVVEKNRKKYEESRLEYQRLESELKRFRTFTKEIP